MTQENVKKKIQPIPVNANQALHSYPPFPEIWLYQQLSISYKLHPKQVLRESDQMLMKIAIISHDLPYPRRLNRHYIHSKQLQKHFHFPPRLRGVGKHCHRRMRDQTRTFRE